jgi:hypothetical protein
LKGKVERLDQHDVADGEPGQHAGWPTLRIAPPHGNASGSAITISGVQRARCDQQPFPQANLLLRRQFRRFHQTNLNSPVALCGQRLIGGGHRRVSPGHSLAQKICREASGQLV